MGMPGLRPACAFVAHHHLRNEVLEGLRLLTKYQMHSENRLFLLLVGPTELRRRWSMAVHESPAQQIGVRHHLTGLTWEELSDYLVHRLRLPGCELPLIEPPAVEALFQATRG
jgi:type II secretory pathway predicted ATPase ExeA